MDKAVMDQADGLRRMMACATTRVLAVVGMQRQVGVTAVAMNLGAALAQQGRDVLLLDEHCPRAESACSVWGLDPPGSLADVARQRLPLEAACARAACGVQVLTAQPGAAPADADPAALCPGGVVLVDAQLDAAGGLSPLARRAHALVLVLQPQPASITATYAGLKQLHRQHPLPPGRLLVNGAAGADQAWQVMANVTRASREFLAVPLAPAGWVRSDPRLPVAQRLSRTVVEAFPASAAAVDYRRVAGELGQWPAGAAAA